MILFPQGHGGALEGIARVWEGGGLSHSGIYGLAGGWIWAGVGVGLRRESRLGAAPGLARRSRDMLHMPWGFHHG